MADSSPLAHSPTLQAGKPRIPGDDEQLQAGSAVGDYVVERFIGAGAMGEVYAGKHPVIGKRVAIKVLRNELAASAEAAERFIREARAVNQIEHENVVDVFAFGRLGDGRLYLVMDLVEGRSLRAHLVDGPLEISFALDILETIAGALDAAHARGVVHRDLKPDNIVLSNAKPPKVFVLDFGIAKLISKANEGKPTGPGTLTGAGTWLGTPGYMAPEQWSVDGAGPASDRYSLGVIAFELFAGALPFSATSVPAMMEHHFRTPVPALSSRGAIGIPPAVDSVLKKALAKDPDARYATAIEMVKALREATGADGRRPRGAVDEPTSPRKLWVPAVAGGLVLGVGAVVLAVGRGDDTDSKPPQPNPAVHVPPGGVTIDVRSTPSGAEVRTATGQLGTTPTQLVSKPGEVVEISVRKPGYLPEKRSVTAGPSGAVAEFALGEVSRFEGVWRLDNGELRSFKRRGDEVDVFKLREVAGEPTFFKHYPFTAVDKGIAFGGSEVVVDPRAPNDPNCNVRMRVDYHYDPMNDVLELRREKVKLDYVSGSCVERARSVEPTVLARMDAAHEPNEISAPVGKPILDKKALKAPPQKEAPSKGEPKTKATAKGETTIPLDPKQELANLKQQKLEASKQPPTKKVSPKNTVGDDLFGTDKAQDVPQQKAAPQQNAAPEQTIPQQNAAPQQKVTPQKSAPQKSAPKPLPADTALPQPAVPQAPTAQANEPQPPELQQVKK